MTSLSNVELDKLAIESDARQAEQLIRRVHEFLGRFVSFPSKEAHVAVALWVVHAHLIERWESTPRLAFLSAEPASGKTRALEILELLVPRPILPVNASPSYLFTSVASEDGLPTVLFDEIDTVFGPKAKDSNEDVRGFLNAGHRRGAVFGRAVYLGNGKRRAEELPAYCAVALAGLGWLPDTILSRSVVIRMRRRHAGERVEPYRRRQHAATGAEIRLQIQSWAQLQPEITEWPPMPDGIQDRDADVWEPLLAVADLVGGSWPLQAREAANVLVAASKETEPSLGIRLLTDTKQVLDADALPSKVLLQKLRDLEESPWHDLKGKPLDERGLAHRLRQYDIRSKNIRTGGSVTKGYNRADFQDIWARYLPPDIPPEKSATSVTPVTTLKTQTAERAGELARVAIVADVAEFPRSVSTPRHCAQCKAMDDGKLVQLGNVYLHKECKPFWFGER
jgi:Protein of unknown function (DUF3631)